MVARQIVLTLGYLMFWAHGVCAPMYQKYLAIDIDGPLVYDRASASNPLPENATRTVNIEGRNIQAHEGRGADLDKVYEAGIKVLFFGGGSSEKAAEKLKTIVLRDGSTAYDKALKDSEEFLRIRGNDHPAYVGQAKHLLAVFPEGVDERDIVLLDDTKESLLKGSKIGFAWAPVDERFQEGGIPLEHLAPSRGLEHETKLHKINSFEFAMAGIILAAKTTGPGEHWGTTLNKTLYGTETVSNPMNMTEGGYAVILRVAQSLRSPTGNGMERDCRASILNKVRFSKEIR